MEKNYRTIFGFWALAFLLLTAQVKGQTPGGASGMVFRFTKQVWLNPTIILAKQNFEQSTNVKLLILPRLNGNDTTGSSKIEKAFDKLLSFLVYKENVQGSIKFYFNPKNPTKPFTFNTSDELFCKFTPIQKDSVETILNQDIINSSNLNNFTALPFDSIINRASRYCKKILQSKPGPCGENPGNEFTLTKINSAPAKLNFEKTTVPTGNVPNGGVDKQKYAELAQYYNTVLDVADNSNYPIAWKAMAANTNDNIKLKLKKKQSYFDINKLVFKNAAGNETYNVAYSNVGNDSTIDLSMSGKSPGSIAEVVAYYTPTTTPTQTFAIGAFNVQFYEKKTYKVILVNLSGTAISNVAAIENTLNEVYSNVFVKWTVETVNYNLPSSISKSIHIESSGLLSNYMPDMQSIISSFKDNCGAYKGDETNTYYLLYGCTNDGNLTGYMPRARNTGFIFDVEPRTVAHEIGHGAFNLKHIFSSEELGEGNKYQTNNIMDYKDNSSPPSQLSIYKHQWDLIHDPAFVSWFGGDDEEAASSELVSIDDTQENLPQQTLLTKTFYYANETRFVKIAFTAPVNVSGYIVKLNNQDYTLMYNKNTLKFKGFYNKQEVDQKKTISPTGDTIYNIIGVSYLTTQQYTIVNEGEYHSHTASWLLILNKRSDITQEQVERLATAINKTSNEAFNLLLKDPNIILPPSPCASCLVNGDLNLNAGVVITPACWDQIITNMETVINASLGKCADIITILNKTTISSNDKSLLIQKFEALSNTDYGLFTAQERLLVLSYFTTGNMPGNVFSSNNAEAYALKILKYADKNQADELLTGLEVKPLALKDLTLKPEYQNNILLYNLDKKIDGGNYTTFAGAIKDLLLNSKKISEKINTALSNGEPRLFIIGIKAEEKNLGLIKLSDASWTSNDQISITKSVIEAFTDVRMPGVSTPVGQISLYTNYRENSLTPYTLSPFDLVFLYNFSGNSNLIEALDADVNSVDGKAVLVPAYFLKFADKTLTNEAIKDGVITTVCVVLDVVTIVKGVPAFSTIKAAYKAEEIINIVRYAKTAYKAIEITTAFGNLSLNLLKDAIPEDSKFRQLVMACNVFMLASLTPHIPTAINGAYSMVRNTFASGKQLITKALLARAIAQVTDQEIALNIISQQGSAAAKEAEALLAAKNRYAYEAEIRYGKTDWENTVNLYRAGLNGAAPDLNILKPKLSYAPSTPLNFTNFTPNTLNVDNYFDIIIHYENGVFIVTKEGSLATQLAIDDIATIINNTTPGKTARLLSCNDLEAARQLSLLTTKPFYASDGWVDFYANGQVRSLNDFKKFENGAESTTNVIAKNSNEIPGVNKITLGIKATENLVPTSLIAKLTQSGANKLKTWTSSKTLTYKPFTGANLSGASAESKIFEDLESAIGNKTVLETIEDGQGRLSVVLERPGQTNQVVTIHPISTGEFKITTLEPAYNPNLNPSIPVPVSVNRLAPDYVGTPYLHPLNQGKVIKITMTGKRTGSTGDFAMADAQMRILDPNYVKPNGYTWHHLDDFNPLTGECTMQLVESTAHQGLGIVGMAHSGSVAQWKAYYVSSNNAPNGLFYQQ